MPVPQPERTLLKPESWPGGPRAALAVLVDLDPPEQPWPAPSTYAAAAGAARLLEMFADLDIVPTVIADPAVQARAGLPEGIEIDVAARIDSASSLADSVATRLGSAPNGFVSLSGAAVEPAGEARWVLDGTGGPWPLAEGDGVVIPYSPWWHDVHWLSPTHPSPPSALFETWSAALASVRSHGELMTVMLSAPYAGQPGFAETMQRFFDETIGAGDVWITNATAVARFARSEARS
jgi:hypothetical protein